MTPTIESGARTIQPESHYNPLALVAAAIERGADADALAKISELAERWLAIRAQETYAQALAAFQAQCPQIRRSRQADRYKYAALDDIMEVVTPLLVANGITVSFTGEEQTEKALRVTCRVRAGSYFEDKSMACPVPAMQKMSGAQEYGAAMSYARRYCLCAALNIVVTDEDDETKLGGVISDVEAAQLADLIDQCEEAGAPVDLEKFHAWLSIERVSDLPRAKLTTARKQLERKLAQAKKAGAGQ